MRGSAGVLLTGTARSKAGAGTPAGTGPRDPPSTADRGWDVRSGPERRSLHNRCRASDVDVEESSRYETSPRNVLFETLPQLPSPVRPGTQEEGNARRTLPSPPPPCDPSDGRSSLSAPRRRDNRPDTALGSSRPSGEPARHAVRPLALPQRAMPPTGSPSMAGPGGPLTSLHV